MMGIHIFGKTSFILEWDPGYKISQFAWREYILMVIKYCIAIGQICAYTEPQALVSQIANAILLSNRTPSYHMYTGGM